MDVLFNFASLLAQLLKLLLPVLTDWVLNQVCSELLNRFELFQHWFRDFDGVITADMIQQLAHVVIGVQYALIGVSCRDFTAP